MYPQHETNPHFRPPPHHQNQPPPHGHGHGHPPHSPDLHSPPQPHHGSDLHPPPPPSHPRHQNRPPQPDLHHPPPSQPRHQTRTSHPKHHLPPPSQPPHRQNEPSELQHGPNLTHYPRTNQRHHLAAPPPRKTPACAWMIACFCTIFWITVILGGLIILIVYLVFRPRMPKFDLSSATLNAAYLDMGYLLNADMTLLANFTNPNNKVNVDFGYMIIGLYSQGTLLATSYIDPFSVMRADYRLANVHLVTSQVMLSPQQSQRLRREMESGQMEFVIRGLFRTRSKLGGIFRYSYWLNVRCTILVTDAPIGAMLRKKCDTKRS